MGIVAIHPAEYVATRIALGDIEGAWLAFRQQYAEGIAAAKRGEPLRDYRPTGWQLGWQYQQHKGEDHGNK